MGGAPNDIETQLLAGQARSALRTLEARTALSPRDLVLRCIAAMLVRPMRKLRNAEARELTDQLVELLNTPERHLANVVLVALSQHYYRPLRRRIPVNMREHLDGHTIAALDPVSHQLAALIPEVRTTLDEQPGRTT